MKLLTTTALVAATLASTASAELRSNKFDPLIQALGGYTETDVKDLKQDLEDSQIAGNAHVKHIKSLQKDIKDEKYAKVVATKALEAAKLELAAASAKAANLDDLQAAINSSKVAKGHNFNDLGLNIEDDSGSFKHYDQRESVEATVNSSHEVKGWGTVNNVEKIKVSGKFHDFTVTANLSVKAGAVSDLEDLVAKVNDLAYDEGFRDGFNQGYKAGWTDAIDSLK